jgi:hypothetical protein
MQCHRSSEVEQGFCKPLVGGSIPSGGLILEIAFLIDSLYLERFPSGQRGQTVNLLAKPSEVRILPSPH